MKEWPTVHIIGGGLAGLSAALEVCRNNARPIVYEATSQLGGRCRSFNDPDLGQDIDCGTHLVLSANQALRTLITQCNAQDQWIQHPARFDFFDLASNKAWCLQPNRGWFPWWLCHPGRRVAGASFLEHIRLLHLLNRSLNPEQMEHHIGHPIYTHLVQPLALAVTNTPVPVVSWNPLRDVLRKTFFRGAQAMEPLVPRTGYTRDLILPLIHTIEAQGGRFCLESPVQQVSLSGSIMTGFRARNGTLTIQESDKIILAVPARAAHRLLPNIPELPMSPIITAHFRIPEHRDHQLVGVIGGLCDWIQTKGSLVSANIGVSRMLLSISAERLLSLLWEEVKDVLSLAGHIPPARLIKERAATLMLTQETDLLRPPTQTCWNNVWLAGDWTATGLPCTLEGAAVSGIAAAQAALSR
ncbi:MULTISPECIES: hydroxysqualene dehydroxylase HpnE [unclassified Haematospirillum]|uniref:hydroxysqualene dehydroxylase HpnE n=1 Tax=unclassified Haematospirillum TaxID=2622088 RepID=UPI0014397819|nr:MULTISPECIES: hydroxysqualene dehydroxylase HpnE [unclassified Haematospirillum]NKD54294.1 NAD(P)-binding protein [Haematospirillum sp. H4890]NKD74338.1 NAD(P)-binding protein [Haematospirillum sp. H4485]